MADTLFDVDPVSEPPQTDGQRRMQRQAAALVRGHHPLAVALNWPIRLHPEAAPTDDRTAPGRRCGNCWYRLQQLHHNRTYPKCHNRDGAWITRGPGTDVRAWWPGCRDHTYGDTALSEDAARYVPGGDR